MRTEQNTVGRRRFLTYLVAAPTLTIAARIGLDGLAPVQAEAVVPSLPQPAEAFDLGDAVVAASAPTAGLMKLEITEDNRVRLELPRAEVGQGITTTAAMIVAEELGARLADVDVPLSDARPEFLYNQITGGSTSVRSLWGPLRTMAAAARARLVTAAAERWGVSATTLSTRDTTVFAPDGRSATYGSLSADAAKVLVPAVSSSPKPASQYTVVGTPTTRIDARDIVTGKAQYPLDIPALKAKEALQISWNAGTIDGLSDANIGTKLASAAPPLLVPGLLTQYLDGEFDFAFVNHAPMEVLSAVADVRAGEAELWFASKTPIVAKQTIARELGLPEDKVTVHVTRAGGSFGRRLFFEAPLEAAQVSKALSKLTAGGAELGNSGFGQTVDELARKLGKDPVAFRLEFLKNSAQRAVLNKVAAGGNWGRTMPSGWAQGVAYHEEYRSRCACLVEIDATTRSAPRVTKAVMAVDVGRAVNPSGLKAQLTSTSTWCRPAVIPVEQANSA